MRVAEGHRRCRLLPVGKVRRVGVGQRYREVGGCEGQSVAGWAVKIREYAVGGCKGAPHLLGGGVDGREDGTALACDKFAIDKEARLVGEDCVLHDALKKWSCRQTQASVTCSRLSSAAVLHLLGSMKSGWGGSSTLWSVRVQFFLRLMRLEGRGF